MAASSSSGKTVLSKHLLQMKFMKRSAIRVEQEQNEAEIHPIDDQHWVLDIPELAEKEDKYHMEPSYVRCEQLKFGRMSYRGFNPEVEKLMRTYDTDAELAAAEEREKEISVNDEEMTNRYSSLVGTIGKKFAKKRKSAPKSDEEEDSPIETPEFEERLKSKKNKKRFLKPSD